MLVKFFFLKTLPNNLHVNVISKQPELMPFLSSTNKFMSFQVCCIKKKKSLKIQGWSIQCLKFHLLIFSWVKGSSDACLALGVEEIQGKQSLVVRAVELKLSNLQ